MRNFRQNFPIYFKFVNCSGGFWKNLNQSVQYFGGKQMSHTLETQLEQNLNQIFFKLQSLGKYFIKIYIWVNSH